MQTFLTLINGEFNVASGIQSTAGVSDAGQMLVTNDYGQLDSTFISDTKQILTSNNLEAGDFINVWNNSGIATVRLACAISKTTQAHGFVLESYITGDIATVYFSGSNSSIVSATPGNVYLSLTPGKFSSTIINPNDIANSGNIIQKLGIATSSTNINFMLDRLIGIA